MSSTFSATTSQPRSLLSIARLNRARSRSRPSTWSFVRMDRTSLGRSGGFAPTIFPLFHGTGFEALPVILKSSVMVTSSVNEVGHSQTDNLLKRCRISDDWRRTWVQFDQADGAV